MSFTSRGVRVYETIKKHLKKNDFHFDAYDDDHRIKMNVRGDDLPVSIIIRVLDERGVMQILSPLPFNMPEDKRIDGAVAVSVANYGIVNGSFDYDMSDGEIRFRITQSFEDVDYNEDVFKYMLRVAFLTVDKYNDHFFMVGKGMMTLKEFIAKENN